MAENHSGSGVVFRRALAVVAAMALLTSLAQVAAAEPSTEEKLDAAKAEFEQLKNQIASQQQVLNRLSAEAAVIAERWEVANGRWEQVTAELRQTELALAEAQARVPGPQGRPRGTRPPGLHHRPRVGSRVPAGRHLDRRSVGAHGVRERLEPGGRRPCDRGAERSQHPRGQEGGPGEAAGEGGEGSQAGRERTGRARREVRRAAGGARRPQRGEGARRGPGEAARQAVPERARGPHRPRVPRWHRLRGVPGRSAAGRVRRVRRAAVRGRVPPARGQRHHRAAGDADPSDVRRVRPGGLEHARRVLGRTSTGTSATRTTRT